MPLAENRKRDLRQRGHALKPIVIIGNAGLTEAVIREIDRSLEHHELMKIRLGGADREAKKRLIASICESCHAELVQSIGHIALIYRKQARSLSE
ncbi:MAG: ribosome assembly RNA-binding protein YhbY [Gammaproteobacteria bacterium]